MTEYRIDKMRFIRPSGKVAERNPDRFGTIYGIFHDAKGNKLTITSKEVTVTDAMATETVIDLAKGILILPSGQKGRKMVASATQDDINSELEKIRKAAAK